MNLREILQDLADADNDDDQITAGLGYAGVRLVALLAASLSCTPGIMSASVITRAQAYEEYLLGSH